MSKEVERKNTTKVLDLIFSIISLLIGGLLYLGYRSQELLMFRWTKCLKLDKIIGLWRYICSQHPLPKWAFYALPDGLWLFSYMLLIHTIWGEHIRQYRMWVYTLPVIAITSELMQLVISSLGTFDMMDIICYSGAILLFELKTRIEWKRKEI